MFPGINNTRLKRKILIIPDFENGFLPTYLPLHCALPSKSIFLKTTMIRKLPKTKKPTISGAKRSLHGTLQN